MRTRSPGAAQQPALRTNAMAAGYERARHPHFATARAHHSREFVQELQIQRPHSHHKVASVLLTPTFAVGGRGARTSESGHWPMGVSDLPANDATQRATSGRYLLLLATFTAAIFVSAALLFMVQPMFTKMVLPRLGGAPSVWSVAIVFFQGALLAGYAYAHWLTRYRAGTSVGRHPSRGHDRRRLCAAAVDRRRLGSTAEVRGNVLADGPVRSLDRPAVLCARRQQPVAAGLVRAHRSPGRERPVFPLCRQQYRKLPCACVLSERDRTVRRAARSGQLLVARLRSADRAAGRLRRAAVAFTRSDGAGDRRGHRGRAADLAGRRVLGGARGRALGPAGGGDRPHFHRCRGRATAVGASARALSPDLRHRVRAPTDHSALARRRRAAGLHHRPRRRAHLRSAQDHRRADRRPPRGVLRQRVDVPWRTGADATGAADISPASISGWRPAAWSAESARG